MQARSRVVALLPGTRALSSADGFGSRLWRCEHASRWGAQAKDAGVRLAALKLLGAAATAGEEQFVSGASVCKRWV